MVDSQAVTLEEARQVHGGIDLEGLVSPYASLTLWRRPGTRTVHGTGRALPDQALAGARVRVQLEELELGTLELRADLPAGLEGREYLDLRFHSDDFVYRGSDQRHCVAFRLQRAALE